MKKVIHSLLLLLALSVPAHASAAGGDDLADVVNRFNSRYPQEKVFVHIDNTGYYQNETVWFKAYVLRTDSDCLGSLSRILYVDLVSPAGVVAETKKCLIKDGTAHGEFLLGRHPGSGIYQIRAYTRYMLNWGDDCVFTRAFPVFRQPTERGDYSQRSITIADGTYSAGIAAPGKSQGSSRVAVSFFPEGGSLVKGISSRVAFEATDVYGRSVEAWGWLVVGKKRVRQVATLREGRGSFSFTPTGEKARLELNLSNGRAQTFDLPEAVDEGFVMTVDASRQDSVTWTESHSPSLGTMRTATLLVHNGKAKAVTSPLWRGDMADGVSQLCLVDHNGAVLCSRMVFNYPKAGAGRIAVSAKDSTIYPDKEVTLDVAATPQSSLSLAVCDAETQLAADTHNAATWLLLTSDLKGYIRHPEYYLHADDSAHRQAADLLMLVQGYRRYDIEAMDGLKEWRKTYPVEHGQLIDGQLRAYRKRNGVDGAKLTITMRGPLGGLVKGSVTTDSTGRYVFAVPDCWGKWRMTMHTTLNDKDKRYYISINRNFSPAAGPVSWYAVNDDEPIEPDLSFAVDTAYIDSIPMSLRDHWLAGVTVTARRRWRTPKEFWEREDVGAKYASVSYDMGKAAEEIADKGEEAPTIVEWLGENNKLFDGTYDNVTGEECKDNPYTALYGDGPTYGNKGIMWIVDNYFVCGTGLPNYQGKDPAFNAESAIVDKYVPFDINGIKSVYVSTEGDDWWHFLSDDRLRGRGIVTIFVYTRPEDKQQKGYRRSTYYGYSVPEEYADLMAAAGDDIAGADYRRTLYWNPDVELGADGRAEVTFKNNSTSRHMTVSAAGFTKDGRPLAQAPL